MDGGGIRKTPQVTHQTWPLKMRVALFHRTPGKMTAHRRLLDHRTGRFSIPTDTNRWMEFEVTWFAFVKVFRIGVFL
jgi:hypothetical protein